MTVILVSHFCMDHFRRFLRSGSIAEACACVIVLVYTRVCPHIGGALRLDEVHGGVANTCMSNCIYLQVLVWVDPLDGTSEFTQGIHV